VASVFAETFGGTMPAEGDSSEGFEEGFGDAGGDVATLWSLGPGPAGRRPAPPVSGWGGLAGGAAGPAGAVISPPDPSLRQPALPGLPAPSYRPDTGLLVVAPAAAGATPMVPGALPALPAPAPAAALVPEPDTWLFLIAGFGMVGLGLRTRRSRRDVQGGRAGAP
jgi:hypothetical protein